MAERVSNRIKIVDRGPIETIYKLRDGTRMLQLEGLQTKLHRGTHRVRRGHRIGEIIHRPGRQWGEFPLTRNQIARAEAAYKNNWEALSSAAQPLFHAPIETSLNLSPPGNKG